jgi:hypothetical protein
VDAVDSNNDYQIFQGRYQHSAQNGSQKKLQITDKITRN